MVSLGALVITVSGCVVSGAGTSVGGVGGDGGGVMGWWLQAMLTRINKTKHRLSIIPSLLIVFIRRFPWSCYASILA